MLQTSQSNRRILTRHSRKRRQGAIPTRSSSRSTLESVIRFRMAKTAFQLLETLLTRHGNDSSMLAQASLRRYESDRIVATVFGRGGRVADCTGLENRRRVKPTGSSNLPLSAFCLNAKDAGTTPFTRCSGVFALLGLVCLFCEAQHQRNKLLVGCLSALAAGLPGTARHAVVFAVV